ncbi:hypothetical protein OK016_04065 [Vibrio chagasii]|nr:hypothetical protein [Vibrio chagasii]
MDIVNLRRQNQQTSLM